MKEFVIVTDTTTDLPREYVEKHHLYMMSLPYTLEGTSYTWENPMPVKEFYDKMRAGSLPTTSQANPEEAATLYESILKENDVDILHIAFSSGLSGSFNSCRIAAATKNTERNNAAPTYTGFILISVDFSCEKFCPRRTTPNVSIMIARNKKNSFPYFRSVLLRFISNRLFFPHDQI